MDNNPEYVDQMDNSCSYNWSQREREREYYIYPSSTDIIKRIVCKNLYLCISINLKLVVNKKNHAVKNR